MAREVRTKTEKPAAGTLSSEQVAEIAARVGLEKLAENVVLLDVRKLSSYADFLVLMTATSDRHAESLARSVDDELRRLGERPIGVEGERGGNWVLIDTGDVVVHVFLEETREFYDLDGLWADAPRKQMEAPAVAKGS